MLEKFDLTLLICMGGNMSLDDFEESQRLMWLVNNNRNNIDCYFEQARFFAKHDDDINVIISYCTIIQDFNNNLDAYIELATYLYSTNTLEWAMIAATEGLKKHHKSEKLQQLLNDSIKDFIDMFKNDK